jgi:prepilin-type N-terminal cleavage/methylation domain-containing protein
VSARKWSGCSKMSVKKGERAFTLVEIMVVVLIVGMLLAIALPNFVNSRSQSRYQAVVASLKQIDIGKQQFAMDKELTNGTVVNNATDLTPTYVKNWPSGPLPNSDYEANPIGTAPTYNGYSAAQLQVNCGSGGSGCPF